MCGIAGLIGVEPALAAPALERMLDSLGHRGPDDRGIERFDFGNGDVAFLGHTRLSIVELSAKGHQPMVDLPRDRSMRPNAVTYNGEIYNFRALQPELADLGFPCHTVCDTEVLLAGYRAWGTECVHHFDGMFAWCLIDPEARTAFLCRDALGIKPLYLCAPKSGGLLFASELRALLAAGDHLVPRKLRRTALESYLAQGAVFGDESIVEGISLLPAGTTRITDLKGRTQREFQHSALRYGASNGTSPQHAPKPQRRRDDTVLALRSALLQAVDSHLLADVDAGVFLSSGLDSTVLAALGAATRGSSLRTVSIGFDEPALDESSAAAEIAKRLGTCHHEVRVSQDAIADVMASVLQALDQPTVDAFNSHLVTGAAKDAGLKVALSGVGADELFGGYASFRDVPRALAMAPLAQRMPLWLKRGLRRPARLAAKTLGGARGRGVAKVGEAARRSGVVELYLLRRELFFPDQRSQLFADAVLDASCDRETGLQTTLLDEMNALTAPLEPLDQVSSLELSLYLRHMLLRDADSMSMAHSLELRVPYLDRHVVQVATAARAAWRAPDPRLKPLLLDAARPHLPKGLDALSRGLQAKRGFTLPWDRWLRGSLNQRARAVFADGQSWSRLGMRPNAVVAMLDAFDRRDPAVSALQIVALWVLSDFATRHGLAA